MDEKANKEKANQVVGEAEPDQLQGQTIFVPKGSDYEVPESGRAMIDFEKLSEDEEGCTLKVTQIEMEGGSDEIPEDMSTMEHVDQFIEGKRGEGGY